MEDRIVVYWMRRQIEVMQAVPGIRHWNLPMNSNQSCYLQGLDQQS
jgi:hypothetical protein